MRYFFTAVSAGPLNNFNYVFQSKCKLEVNFLSLFNVNRFILLFKDDFCSQGSQLSCPFMGLTFDYLSSRGSISLWVYSPVEARRNWHAPVFKISPCLPICGLSLVVRLLGMVLVAGLKKIIVVSSVSHIGFSFFLPLFEQKPTGKILDLIAHVLVPPLCSLLCITFIYIVTHGIQ